jgi:hypothetical protein
VLKEIRDDASATRLEAERTRTELLREQREEQAAAATRMVTELGRLHAAQQQHSAPPPVVDPNTRVLMPAIAFPKPTIFILLT